MIAITPFNVGNTEPPEFNEDTLRIPKRQQMTGFDKPVG